MKFRVTLLIVAFLAFTGVVQATETSEEHTLWMLINDHRQANGVQPVSLSNQLTAAAEWMSQDMAAKDYVSHTDSLGRGSVQRMSDFGCSSGWTGENLTVGMDNAQAAFNVWKGAPEHNAVMLDPNYKVVGVARAYREGSTYGWYWVVDFGGSTPVPRRVVVTPVPSPIPVVTPSPTPVAQPVAFPDTGALEW